jgi:hypothetical protein
MILKVLIMILFIPLCILFLTAYRWNTMNNGAKETLTPQGMITFRKRKSCGILMKTIYAQFFQMWADFGYFILFAVCALAAPWRLFTLFRDLRRPASEWLYRQYYELLAYDIFYLDQSFDTIYTSLTPLLNNFMKSYYSEDPSTFDRHRLLLNTNFIRCHGGKLATEFLGAPSVLRELRDRYGDVEAVKDENRAKKGDSTSVNMGGNAGYDANGNSTRRSGQVPGAITLGEDLLSREYTPSVRRILSKLDNLRVYEHQQLLENSASRAAIEFFSEEILAYIGSQEARLRLVFATFEAHWLRLENELDEEKYALIVNEIEISGRKLAEEQVQRRRKLDGMFSGGRFNPGAGVVDIDDVVTDGGSVSTPSTTPGATSTGIGSTLAATPQNDNRNLTPQNDNRLALVKNKKQSKPKKQTVYSRGLQTFLSARDELDYSVQDTENNMLKEIEDFINLRKQINIDKKNDKIRAKQEKLNRKLQRAERRRRRIWNKVCGSERKKMREAQRTARVAARRKWMGQRIVRLEEEKKHEQEIKKKKRAEKLLRYLNRELQVF